MQVGVVLAVSAAGMAFAAALAWLVLQAVLRLTFGRSKHPDYSWGGSGRPHE
jgi:hypothetical protein